MYGTAVQQHISIMIGHMWGVCSMVGLHSAVPGVVHGGGGDLVGYLAPRMTVSSTRLTRLMARQRKTLSSLSCCTIAHTKVNRNSRLCTNTAWSAQEPATGHTSSPVMMGPQLNFDIDMSIMNTNCVHNMWRWRLKA